MSGFEIYVVFVVAGLLGALATIYVNNPGRTIVRRFSIGVWNAAGMLFSIAFFGGVSALSLLGESAAQGERVQMVHIVAGTLVTFSAGSVWSVNQRDQQISHGEALSTAMAVATMFGTALAVSVWLVQESRSLPITPNQVGRLWLLASVVSVISALTITAEWFARRSPKQRKLVARRWAVSAGMLGAFAFLASF